MVDAETQTEDFIILTDEYYEKLTKEDKKIYNIEFKANLKQIKTELRKERVREYDRNRSKMKLKYNPVFREERRLYCEQYNRDKAEFNRNKKIEKQDAKLKYLLNIKE
jgi:uncharacterized transporter YbjL